MSQLKADLEFAEIAPKKKDMVKEYLRWARQQSVPATREGLIEWDKMKNGRALLDYDATRNEWRGLLLQAHQYLTSALREFVKVQNRRISIPGLLEANGKGYKLVEDFSQGEMETLLGQWQREEADRAARISYLASLNGLRLTKRRLLSGGAKAILTGYEAGRKRAQQIRKAAK